MADTSKNQIIYWTPKSGYFTTEDGDDGKCWILKSSGERTDDSIVCESSKSDQAAADGLGFLALQEKDDLTEWQINSPEKLVVAALIDLHRRGSVNQIKERIESTIDVNWDKWWSGARARLAELPFMRFQPNRTISIDQGFGINDIPDNDQTSGKRKILSNSELEQLSKELAKGTDFGKEKLSISISEFRRLVRILISNNSLDILLRIGLSTDQLWSIFDHSEDPAVQARVSARAIVSSMGPTELEKLERLSEIRQSGLITNLEFDEQKREILKGSSVVPKTQSLRIKSSSTSDRILEKPDENIQQFGYVKLPKLNDQKTLKTFLPRVFECQRLAVQSGDDAGLHQIITVALRGLLIQASPEDISGVRIVEDLIVNCLRLQPDTLVELLLNLSTDDQIQFIQQSLADRLFGSRKLSRQLAAGIWSVYNSDERRNGEIALQLSRSAFAENKLSDLARLASALIQHNVSTQNLNTISPTTLLLAAESMAIDREAASVLEEQFIGDANSFLRSGNTPTGTSLGDLVTRVIVNISSSQRSTNRRLRSELNNLNAEISRLGQENMGLRQRLSDLSRESSQSIIKASIETQRGLLKQVADALQFAQSSVGKSDDALRIASFSGTLAELQRYLPIRSQGYVNERLAFDSGKLVWKGDRSNRPSAGDPVTLIAQGWDWSPNPNTTEILTRGWCVEPK